MRLFDLICYILAAVLFLAAFVVSRPSSRTAMDRLSPVPLLALGLLAWVLVPLVQTARGVN